MRGTVGIVTHSRGTDEPIADDVPVADAVEQRQEVGEQAELSEGFAPTEVSEIAAHQKAPADVNPADWQDQLTSADSGGEDWQSDI